MKRIPIRIAPEAANVVIPVLLLAFLLILWFLLGGGSEWAAAATVPVFAAVLLLLLFRDPKRIIPKEADSVLAPADGRVVSIEQTAEEGLRIAIFLSLLDVHVNRVPASCTVQKVNTRPGIYLNAAARKASDVNAQIEVRAQSPYGGIVWRQISGLIARKISCQLKAGDVCRAGETFGLIYLGSRMEVDLPRNTDPAVVVGQHVRAGETIIARFQQKAE